MIASSVNSLIFELVTDSGRSFMKERNSKGPSTVPCGTPEHTCNGLLASWFTTTLCSRFVRNDLINLLVVSVIPLYDNLYRRRL